MITAAAAAVAAGSLVGINTQQSAQRGEPVEARVLTTVLADAFFPGRLDVSGATGEIAVGRVGPGPGQAFPVRSVDPLSGAVQNISFSPVSDPDAVAWDDEGRIGPAGAVLVGSIDGIFSVTPGGEPALEIPAGSVISNPEDIAFDSQGRLVIANFSSRVLVRFDPFSQTITELAEFPLGILQFALDGDDNAYVVNPGGGIAVVPPDGSGIDRVIGEGQFTGVAVVGDGAAVLPGLYTFDLETGDLLQLDESGQAVRVLAERFEPRTVPAGTVLPAAAELELTETGRLLFAVTETSELSTLFDPCARADVDGDGLITSTDFFAWVAGFGSGDPAADINADGVADVTDFFLFAATTGTCGG